MRATLRVKRFKRGVGLRDALEPLFGSRIAAGGVRMQPLHQFLVAAPDFGEVRVQVQIQNVKRSFFLGPCTPLLPLLLVRPLLPTSAIEAGKFPRLTFRLMQASTWPATQTPRRPVPEVGAAAFGFNLRFAHAPVKIPARVVGAYVFQTEPKVLAQSTRSGRCLEADRLGDSLVHAAGEGRRSIPIRGQRKIGVSHAQSMESAGGDCKRTLLSRLFPCGRAPGSVLQIRQINQSDPQENREQAADDTEGERLSKR